MLLEENKYSTKTGKNITLNQSCAREKVYVTSLKGYILD